MLQFFELRQKKERLIIGLMCGTSVDSVDTALCRIRGSGSTTEVKLLHYLEYPVPAALRQEIFAAFRPESSRVDQLCQLNFAIGELFAEAVNTLLSETGIQNIEIDCIGSHGQTVYHIPERRNFAGKPMTSTLQLGSAAIIAERTGITTISDFRSRDMAAGGQGAPLVPYVDYLIFTHPQKGRILQNIGGIANFTFLPAAARPQDIVACDSGPGNMILDALAQRLLDQPCDWDGLCAAHGQINRPLLTKLLQLPYLQLPPPKSTGRELFGVQFTENLLQTAMELQLSKEDLLATATAFTAETIIDHYIRCCFTKSSVDEVILSGGGAKNLTLVRMLKQALPQLTWLQPEDFGLRADAKEAVAFAVLANETLCGHPGNLPSATGASHPVILGSITLK